MKKFGFTLPEVMIALAIIGVIGAITIPQVVSNVEARKTGALLGRAAEQISLACQNAIQEYNDEVTDGRYAEKLSDNNNIKDKLEAHLGLVDIFISTADEEKYAEKGISTADWKKLSKSPVYINTTDYINFLVDVNGFSGKNYGGIDQFNITLNNNCTIKPKGNAAEIFQNDFRVKVD